MDKQQKTSDLLLYRVVVVGLTSALVLTISGIIYNVNPIQTLEIDGRAYNA